MNTEIVPDGVLQAMPDLPMLASEDISAAVLYVLGTAPHVQVLQYI